MPPPAAAPAPLAAAMPRRLPRAAAAAAAATWALPASAGIFEFTERYAAGRSDYYLRRAEAVPADSEFRRCLAAAAMDVSPANATVAEHAAALGLPPAARRPVARPSLQLGALRGWRDEPAGPGEECAVPAGTTAHDVFPTPMGLVHISDLGLKDWSKTLDFLEKTSIEKFDKVYNMKGLKAEDRQFTHVNNRFFKYQDTNPQAALSNPKKWKKMYTSPLYKEWAKAAPTICTSYLRKLGVHLTEEEEEGMETVLWAAVYPNVESDVITHYYHAHQESVVSFVLYVAMPEPTTPMTVADPRGAPPVEDFEWFQYLGDLGIDGDPPFHSTLEFFPGNGDVLIFPSWAIHKVPPHIGKGTRVAWPGNCHFPKHAYRKLQLVENPLDGWERLARWRSGVGLRPNAAPAYAAHSRAILALGSDIRDPYMKSWEVQNQIIAILQSNPGDARAWVDAGNAAWGLAYLLAGRDEGDYFADALTFYTQALALDPSLQETIQSYVRSFETPRLVEPRSDAAEAAAPWRQQVLDWKRPPKPREFVQCLVETLNGPGRCSRMCAKAGQPAVPAVKVLPLWASRVLETAVTGSTEAQDQHIADVARSMLGVADVALHWVAVQGGCWLRNRTASLAGVLCERTADVWFADPRGAWPEHWNGSVSAGPTAFASGAGCLGGGGLLASEPKAPFHWHAVLHCEVGKALLFPAWLPHQVAPDAEPGSVRAFSVAADWGAGAGGWRVPVQQPLCRERPAPAARSEL